jgi:anthranilate synthase component 1
MQLPSRDDFLSSAQDNVLSPVYRDILADMETPLSAYWKLSHDETYSFLLESVTGGEQLARYSILGSRPRVVLRTKGRKGQRHTRAGLLKFEIPEGKDPLDVLSEEMGPLTSHQWEGMPKFVGGAVGMMGYDLVRFFENLINPPEDFLELDDLVMLIPESIVVFDHAKNLLRIIVLAEGTAVGYEAACAEIERVSSRLKRPIPDLPAGKGETSDPESNWEPEEFEDSVSKIIELIGRGEGIQMVLSQRFSRKTDAHPLTVYRALRSLNPSPYMFLLRLGDFDMVGASPELLVSLFDQTARVRPIAGTRSRGMNQADDERLAIELLADEKERAEHLMLVDLGRNDLGRVCKYGSVTVNEFMVIERYSHVMHIVSDVSGQLNEGQNAFSLIRSTFPAGTVSGAPKVRAMQIIDELEPSQRGPYAGTVGYISQTGDMDLAISIRTIVMAGGMAHVQAGAGIVWDSVPSHEEQECRKKARAALTALESANSGKINSL